MYNVNLGENLRNLREKRGLDRLDVSVETGYSESHIAQIERNVRQPSLTCLLDLMDFYECSAEAIFGVAEENRFADVEEYSLEARLNALPFKDRKKAERLIFAVLDTFEGKDGGVA